MGNDIKRVNMKSVESKAVKLMPNQYKVMCDIIFLILAMFISKCFIIKILSIISKYTYIYIYTDNCT